MELLTVFILCFVISALLVPVAIHYLLHRDIMDTPRVQSAHVGLIPRGGGIGVLPVVWAGWLWMLANGQLGWPTENAWLAVLIGSVVISYLSWKDDVYEDGLSVRLRLLVQLVSVSIPLYFWPLEMGQVLPEWVPNGLERVLLALGWVWFLNLFNFMDGINGITGTQSMSISLGIVVLSVTGAIVVPSGVPMAAIMIAGASAGFLVWNARPVAKVFLGDVGSIGLGYCLAWLLIIVAAQNYLIVGLLLALVYLTDATFTLVKRGLQGKKIWQAHREHCYHMATVKGALTHLQCVAVIVAMNCVLIALAYAAAVKWMHPFACLGIGFAMVVIVLRIFWIIGLRANAKAMADQPNL